ncbi:Serine/threonine-protein kinase AfsK [Planctomycetes bacterium CA13]|uniref:Serine/threonine-protein kinase AfsK n=1 Tax=Novipirellula herctigrandis TaxID=2527986 RepID=A0A5C5Z9W1_9BACT|nr:Serine/threonine-protein kinase AfsK [Planctomycetes bacterium CA13]
MLRRLAPYHFIHLAVFALIASSAMAAEDWPMWRFDAERSAASPNEIAGDLVLLWEQHFPRRQQAWDDPLNLDLMTYDRIFEPIVSNGRVFIGFNDADKLLALDADTGMPLWTFYTEAPVRLPPAAWNEHIFFTSDDGFLYCVSAADGKLVWKFDGTPNSQHAIGNQRITSAWPARGGPVIRDGTVYFAAGIWPFMGTFIYALDAHSGDVRWVNDNTGSQYIKQPHSAPSFAGVAPQGALAASDSSLIVPGGRSVPAVFDRANGKLRYYELNAGGKGTGGSFVAVDQTEFYVHTRLKGTRAFHLSNGIKTAFTPNEPVLHQGMVYSAEKVENRFFVRAYADEKKVWEIEADGTGDLIMAGNRLIAAGEDEISIIECPRENGPAKVVQSIPLDHRLERLIVADQKIFGVSIDGRILAYGKPKPTEIATSEPPQIQGASDRDRQVARDLFSVGDAEGYAFWFGSSQDQRARAIAMDSPFVQFAIVDSDASSVDQTRRYFDASEIYGRVTVHHSNADSFRAPKYVANMIFAQDACAMEKETLELIYQSVRPYGGVLHLLASENLQTLSDRVNAIGLEQANVTVGKHGVIVRREGALPGSADWTHQYGNIANTIKSDDSRVKLPLGILWFGGSSNMDVLPRHGHGPPEQVVGGRLFIEGMNCLSARDVYTGRVLWKHDFADLGTFDVFYDSTYENAPLNPKYNQVHIPGANARGTNYVVTEDRVYLVEDNVCHALDPKTGKALADFHLPTSESGEKEQWGYLGVYKDVLIGGLGFAMYRGRNNLAFDSDKKLSATKAGFGSKSYDRAASVALVGFDRHSGEQLWKVDANHSFWHNGIVAGGDKVYCLDRNPQQIEEALRRRGKSRPATYRITAFDFQTGEPAWEIDDNIFGTWLGYSEQHDLLLQAGSKATDRLSGEAAQGMAVYSGADGAKVWNNDTLDYTGPCILHNDLIITNANSYSQSAGAFYLRTGKPKMVRNPLTGEMQPWSFTRAYGCNSVIASENLLTFRSGAAGFYDLLTDTGTGNLGGFKSGCTSNLVVANGVLNAPDYTRTCSCPYQNQTSLALVHMPDIDTWSVHSGASAASNGKVVESLSINLGAPGDRRDVDGDLWLEYPVVAGVSPPLTIRANPEARFFQHHSSSVESSKRPWLLASGADAITDLRIELRLKDKYNLDNGIPVQHADDDAEEDENGNVDLASSDLELVEESGIQVVGMRFNKINLARGTPIRAASIQFTCDETSTESVSLIIAAEDTGNAARYNDHSHDLTSRSLTRQEVGWKPKAWKKVGEAGNSQRTPDLAALVQAIVDREDWKAGNSIAFQISGVGKRVASSYSGSTAKAARLIIDADALPVKVIGPPKHFDVELFFAVPKELQKGIRVFDVYAQGERVAQDVTLDPTDGSGIQSLRLNRIAISNELHLRFVAKQGEPILSGVRVTQH